MIKDFLRFIRLETCLFISGIALSGYLLFNQPDWIMLLLFATTLFSCATIYSYNHLKDKKEYKENRSLNPYAVKDRKDIPILTGLFSFLFAILLPFHSFLLFLFLFLFGIFYSATRIKSKFFLIKNLYTAFSLGMVFLIGASVYQFEEAMFIYFGIVFLFGWLLNLLGDIRGVEGDRVAGVKSIPVILGYKIGKRIAYLLLLFLISVCTFFSPFRIFVPFLFAILIFLYFDLHKPARFSLLLSFILFPLTFLII